MEDAAGRVDRRHGHRSTGNPHPDGNLMSDDSGLWLLAAGPAGATALYWALYRYYRNSDKSHSFEHETEVKAQPVTGSNQKVGQVRGTEATRIEGDNVYQYRIRVARFILAVEHQHRRFRQRLRVDPVGEIALVEIRRAGRHVTHAAQRVDAAALHGIGQRGHGAQHRAVAQQRRRVVLVFGQHVQRGPRPGRKLQGRVDEPGFQAVVVDRDGDAGVGNLVVRHAQPIQCIVFQERRLFRQLHQHLAVRRSGRRHGSLAAQAAPAGALPGRSGVVVGHGAGG
ncbi:hypothetical protein G6F68_011431 [Rhizopus microsporus]|nr:hypothetical protein G6F68_011431 [Rhizopus microsporus]